LERSDIWLVRRLSQKAADFGAIVIDLGNVPIDAIKEMRAEVVREFGSCRPNGGIHRNTSTVFQLVFWSIILWLDHGRAAKPAYYWRAGGLNLPGACKADFENALFVYPDAPPGNAPGREDHLEVERKTPLLSNAQRKAPL
jgi:hypothetical protein